MKVLIATGIYPPQIGGPATYAKNLAETFVKMNHVVSVKYFGFEHKLPTIVRHFWFFMKSVYAVWKSDFILALDAFSVGTAMVLASKIFHKKIVIRIGGDFLWETYINRTGKTILLSDFYKIPIEDFNLKEKIIFKITKWTLCNASVVVFSTNWQKEIFLAPYGLSSKTVRIIENFYGPKESGVKDCSNEEVKNFVGGVRDLKWKKGLVDSAFLNASKFDKSIHLDKETCGYNCFFNKIKNSYAVILVSLSDISPNMILDAVRCNKPFILTRENGLDRLSSLAILVDPQNEKDITEKILWLAKRDNYLIQKKKIEEFDFVHSWEEIAREFINIFEQK